MSKGLKKPEDYIVPLNMNGLEGRMLRLPAKFKSKNEILFVYGSHSSLERWWGIAQALNKLGAVTMPDLPGLGGMTPLYKIGLEPTIDNMADYLAAFVKLKYRNKKVTIIAMSLGFVITTRMLQKNPELAKKIGLLISVVGFAHYSDFVWSKTRYTIYRLISKVFSRKWPSIIFKHTALQPVILRLIYHRTHHAKEKFADLAGDEFKRTMEMEVKLWHINDIRTQFKHYTEMFKLDNTKEKVNLPVHHVAAKKDRYFNNLVVEEHMRRVFTDFIIYYTKSPNHAPTIVADTKQGSLFIPTELGRKLRSLGK